MVKYSRKVRRRRPSVLSDGQKRELAAQKVVPVSPPTIPGRAAPKAPVDKTGTYDATKYIASELRRSLTAAAIVVVLLIIFYFTLK
jgi:hypothetical protein